MPGNSAGAEVKVGNVFDRIGQCIAPLEMNRKLKRLPALWIEIQDERVIPYFIVAFETNSYRKKSIARWRNIQVATVKPRFWRYNRGS